MIAELVTYLNTKTELTGIVDKIIYRKPIKDIQPAKYIYITYSKTRERTGYKYRVQFNLYCDTSANLELLASNLECLLVGGSKVPTDLKTNLPKLWKTILVNQVPFPDELVTTIDYEFYYNF